MNRGLVRLIAGREIRERLRTKSFAALTALNVVLIIGVGVIGGFAGRDEPDTIQVGVTQPVPQRLATVLVQAASAFGRTVEVVPLPGSEARRAVEDEDVDAAIIVDEGELLFPSEPDERLAALVQQAWADDRRHHALRDVGLAPGEIDAALSPQPLRQAYVTEPDDADDAVARVVGTATSVLLFVTLQTFGGYVLVGVVEEKSTGVGEIVLARVAPGQLLAGKVIGVGVTALVQVAASVTAGFVSLPLAGVDVPAPVWATLPTAIVWFILGYALYATCFALAGALVSRQEDAQAAAAPITTVLIASYVAVYLFGYVPDSTASTILSLVPPLTPFLMPMRMASGAASVAEITLSALLLLGAIVVVARLAGRVYEQVVLHRGSRIPWSEALSL
ncbi:MAG TPA: ABC transporter permease, partial [Acidimicrobiia bacterium]|nr:ABC transporter permease [Acidimicrobiia bacterium]